MEEGTHHREKQLQLRLDRDRVGRRHRIAASYNEGAGANREGTAKTACINAGHDHKYR